MSKFGVIGVIKLRRKLLKRLAELHKDMLIRAKKERDERFDKGLPRKGMGLTELEKEIVGMVRRDIGYSSNTTDCDIYCGICKYVE